MFAYGKRIAKFLQKFVIISCWKKIAKHKFCPEYRRIIASFEISPDTNEISTAQHQIACKVLPSSLNRIIHRAKQSQKSINTKHWWIRSSPKHNKRRRRSKVLKSPSVGKCLVWSLCRTGHRVLTVRRMSKEWRRLAKTWV